MCRTAHNKSNKEAFVKCVSEIHNNFYDYSNVVYVNNLTKVEIGCPIHGTFLQTPKSHKTGAGCSKCGRESQIKAASKGKEKFVEDGRNIYGDKNTYHKVEYVNTNTEVIVTCSIHGDFDIKPAYYLSGTDCPKCGKTRSSDKDMFIEEAVKVYGDKDDYTDTEVISSKHKVKIRCKTHDIVFEKNIQSYLLGCGCPACSAENYSKVRTKTTEKFVEEAKEVHGDNCDYTDTIYKSAKDKVKIKCNIHNEYFETLPATHIKGGSCRKCLSERISAKHTGKEGTGGYTRSGYVKQANGREAKVYLIRCFEDGEEFYKIGKTFLSMDDRFTKGNMPYEFKEEAFHRGEVGYIYDLENILHRKYKEYKYRPSKWFAGYTECFDMTLPMDEVFKDGREDTSLNRE